MSNVVFNYLYRDASNYKNYGNIILENPDNLTIEEATKRIRKTLICGENFIASQIDVPEIFLWLTSEFNVEDDHYYHEFSGIEETELSATDERTLSDFISKLEEVGPIGWDEVKVQEDHWNSTVYVPFFCEA